MSTSSVAAPTNATLANAVAPKDLASQKKHLDHVSIDERASSVHLGPTKQQADFPPNAVHQHSSTSAIGTISGGGNHVVESAKSGEVSVQSSVTIDTTQEIKPQAAAQIQALLARLSTTTTQIDEYSRRANEQISAEASREIQRIIAETQAQQDALLKDASTRSLEIETEYSNKLKSFLQELDASKASNLASLEKDLNFKQERLLSAARDDMDRVHQISTQKKIFIMQNANESAIRDVNQLTEQVKSLGEQEVERRLASTTTTVITTQTSTEAANKTIVMDEQVGAIKDRTTVVMTEKDTKITNTKNVVEPRTTTITRI